MILGRTFGLNSVARFVELDQLERRLPVSVSSSTTLWQWSYWGAVLVDGGTWTYISRLPYRAAAPADAATCASRDGWAAPTRPPRSRACSYARNRSRRSGKRHPELGRLRLVVTRGGESDVMTLKAECTSPNDALQDRLAASLCAVTKLGGSVELVPSGSLPNDGKAIADERG